MASEIISRKDARAQGLKRYFTGEPCPSGHSAERLVSNFCCVQCNLIRNKSAQRKAKNDVSVRAWIKLNPEKVRRYGNISRQRRRARKNQAVGNHTAAEVDAILKAQNYRCAYCAADLREVNRHLDHIIPLSRGGSNAATNVQWTCQPCNQSKHTKDPIVYAQSIGLLL